MEYITESTDKRAVTSESKKIQTIHKRVKEVKQSEKTGVKIMQRWEELVLEREEGRKEGLKAGKAYEIYSLVQDGDISPERGAERLGITVEALKGRMTDSGYQYSEDVQDVRGV